MKNVDTIRAKEKIKGGARFFTDDDVNVTNRISKNQTEVFLNKDEADAYAKSKRSYAYDLIIEEPKKERVFYGYAVPK